MALEFMQTVAGLAESIREAAAKSPKGEAVGVREGRAVVIAKPEGSHAIRLWAAYGHGFDGIAMHHHGSMLALQTEARQRALNALRWRPHP